MSRSGKRPRLGRGSHGARWTVQYQWRMDQGLEHCRGPECDATERLTLDHIRPASLGGSRRLDNTAILCESCQRDKADRTDPPWCDLPSLAQEEAAAPPERRWSEQEVPEEVQHRIRSIRKRANRAAAGKPLPWRPSGTWRNEGWHAQLAMLEIEERSG